MVAKATTVTRTAKKITFSIDEDEEEEDDDEDDAARRATEFFSAQHFPVTDRRWIQSLAPKPLERSCCPTMVEGFRRQ